LMDLIMLIITKK